MSKCPYCLKQQEKQHRCYLVGLCAAKGQIDLATEGAKYLFEKVKSNPEATYSPLNGAGAGLAYRVALSQVGFLAAQATEELLKIHIHLDGNCPPKGSGGHKLYTQLFNKLEPDTKHEMSAQYSMDRYTGDWVGPDVASVDKVLKKHNNTHTSYRYASEVWDANNKSKDPEDPRPLLAVAISIMGYLYTRTRQDCP